MVHIDITDRLGEVIAAGFQRVGLTSLRRAAEATGIKRLTLTRRLESGGFTVLELEQIAPVLGYAAVSDLVAEAERGNAA